jgi:hypothetical protein
MRGLLVELIAALRQIAGELARLEEAIRDTAPGSGRR